MIGKNFKDKRMKLEFSQSKLASTLGTNRARLDVLTEIEAWKLMFNNFMSDEGE